MRRTYEDTKRPLKEDPLAYNVYASKGDFDIIVKLSIIYHHTLYILDSLPLPYKFTCHINYWKENYITCRQARCLGMMMI